MTSFDSNRLITNDLKLINAQQFFEYVNNGKSANSGLYIFAGKSNGWPLNNTPVPNNSIQEHLADYRNMLFGKQITNNNIYICITRNDWEANTIYTKYSDFDGDLWSKPFYVGVLDGTSYNVFKCIDNNSNSLSTVPPNLADTSESDTFYQTSDGYQWKYMYSIGGSIFSNYGTSNFIPVVPNANVAGNAVPGTIDVINVANSGAFYNNYYSGQFNFSDIQINGNTINYNLSNTASSNNDFYSGSLLLITSGTGAGQYKKIVSYNVTGNNKIATINSAFSVIPDVTSTYVISPLVEIYGDGYQTANAVARAIVNSNSSNSISSIEILNKGVGYNYATAVVLSSNTIPASGAILDPVVSPIGGHGSNVYDELGGTRVVIGNIFSVNESNTITTNNSYSQIGIIKDPLFANVTLNILNSSGTPGSNGTFLPGEAIYQVTPITLGGTVSIAPTSNVATGTLTQFNNSFDNGDYILFTSGSNTDINKVSTIANNTSLTLVSNSSFLSNNANVSMVQVTAKGKAISFNGNAVNMTNVAGIFTQGSLIVGETSGASGYVNNNLVGYLSKGFSTFNQLTYVTGTITGTFITNETFTQQSSNSSGSIHSYDGTNLYLTDVIGNININDTIVGETSGAIINITTKYTGDLVKDSGEFLYVEDLVQKITRASVQSEAIKIILEF
jgi:hypothetical protein